MRFVTAGSAKLLFDRILQNVALDLKHNKVKAILKLNLIELQTPYFEGKKGPPRE